MVRLAWTSFSWLMTKKERTTEPAEDETSTLEPPSVFMYTAHNFPESSFLGKTETTRKKVLPESPRRRRIEGAARVSFLGTLSKEDW